MKIRITLLLLTFHLFTFSQINFQDKITLIDDTHNPYDINSIAIADLDNDSWKDLIITSYDDKIMWYRNVNGDFRHFQRNIISINQIDIPKFITTADLNNDGLLDLIVVNDSSADKIFWFQNMGNGDFSSEILISGSINGASSIEPIDIDNDGDIDVLTGGATQAVILIENNNDGTFQAPQIIYNGSSFIRQVKSKDLNNDGLSDIITSHSNGAIYWAENLGNNVFGDREYITGSSDNGSALDFIDINEDGFLDIITANNYSNDNVRYILNQNGTDFDNDNPVIIDDTIQEPYNVSAKDIDNDGKKDIVVSFWTNDNISWYKNLGNGNFSTAFLITDSLNNPKSFTIEDVDNDGFNDVVSSSNSTNDHKLSVFKNENNGSVFNEVIINNNYVFIEKIKVSDLNNDNLKDIIVIANDIFWFENYGTNFSSYKLISSNNNTATISENFIDIALEDINNDGHKDVLGFNNTSISILTNNGDETFTDQIFQYSPTSGFKNPIYADFDGDNLKDVLVSIPSSTEHKIGFIKRLNFNTFDSLQIIDIPFHNGSFYYKIFDMALSDVENDGDMDVILSASNVNAIWIMNNDGFGNFVFEDATMDTNSYPSFADRQIHIEDIDNDNFEDIVLYRDRYDNQASSSSYYIFQLKNVGGTFAGNDIMIDSGGASVSAMTFKDIDNNGYKDLFYASSAFITHNIEEAIYYYLNDGSTFQPKVEIDNTGIYTSGQRDIVLEDINNDGKLDIITSYGGKRAVDYYFNNSTLSIIDYDINTDGYSFFPVPFSDTLNWQNTTNEITLNLDIYDINGKKVYSKNNYKKNKVNLEFLKPGIYLITITSSNNRIITRKIIKK